jgi:hypothetical protein
VVDEQAAITSDPGLWKSLGEHGIECLLISPGFIELKGYDSGFIGGASGKIGRNTIAFTGHLNEHPDRERIFHFLDSRGVKAFMLTRRAAFDVGSILPFLEQGSD